MGVKQLWSLLGPAGRPVLLETMEATMRDKEGRGLVNAHILGFLRRICKLLYYGIKPVFVFDGGAPALKRSTLNERRKKKSGAADSHVKVAERLLAAQLRREALKHVTEVKQKRAVIRAVEDDDDEPSAPIDDSAVYLEDLEGPNPVVVPPKPAADTTSRPKTPPSKSKETPEKAKKNKWQDHDPYKLPEMDFEGTIAKATSSNLPDPRLATEAELQAFIDDMRPEDFDINSDAFHELPTEVQYEIIGDLRLKSRQTSHKRLQSMLRQTNTALDFSKAQIQNLRQRNALTQQLLVTTNMVARANLTIPIRVASERNREYLLIKNHDGSGGWVLGVRDEGTAEKPIAVDEIKSDEESPPRKPAAKPDGDLREFRQTMALAAIGKRQSPVKRPKKPRTPPRKPAKPLFLPDDENDADMDVVEALQQDDVVMDAAIQESLEDAEAEDLRRAIAASVETAHPVSIHDSEFGEEGDPLAGPSGLSVVDKSSAVLHPGLPDIHKTDATMVDSARGRSSSSSLNDTAPVMNRVTAASLLFGLSADLDEEPDPLSGETPGLPSQDSRAVDSDDEFEEVIAPSHQAGIGVMSGPISDSDSDDMEEVLPSTNHMSYEPRDVDMVDDDHVEVIPKPALNAPTREDLPLEPQRAEPQRAAPNAPAELQLPQTFSPSTFQTAAPGPAQVPATPPQYSAVFGSPLPSPRTSQRTIVRADPALSAPQIVTRSDSPPPGVLAPLDIVPSRSPPAASFDASDDDFVSGWSRSPSPVLHALQPEATTAAKAMKQVVKDFDAADELDPVAEEGDFAKFISQVKGQDLDAARKEVDAEILALNKERKAAMRDSEDVTQQMIGQIKLLLRLFGIPYVTAPMEAEAQCAALVEYGLVDGVITDDSDIFLFGGKRVFRNMFNQSKTVECFLLADLAKELGLDRSTLVRLAYLLGSDYTDGLPGVGPVVAMELLKEFPGDDGLIDFKNWWRKVQSGKDTDAESGTKFRQRFKKKFKNLYLPEEWPNPKVQDGYYAPTIDESREQFSWAIPDIDGLRKYLHEELGWNAEKVDQTLLPIVKKVGQRGRANAVNKQSDLNNFFDITAGTGTYAPRQKQAYASKRLQKVVADFRKGKAKANGDDASVAASEDELEGAQPKRRRRAAAPRAKKTSAKKKTTAGSRKKRKVEEESEEEAVEGNSEKSGEDEDGTEARAAALSLRPNLRSRLKPKPKPAPQIDPGGEQESDSDASFTLSPVRKRKV